MSKTVMRVMMVGLVALLGAKAEAHYVYYAGKYRYCSVCNEATLKAENDSIDPNTHTEKLKFVLTTKVIEILCPNGDIHSIDEDLFPQFMSKLAVQRTIGEGDITTLLNGNVGSLTTAAVKACVSDAALLVDNTLDPICGVPSDVLIRKMKAKIKTKACDVLNPLTCDTVSTSEADCTLPDKFNLKNYPNNLPKGALYNCEY